MHKNRVTHHIDGWLRKDLGPEQFGRHARGLAGNHHHPEGLWAICTPAGSVTSVPAHRVTEHDDGSITVVGEIETHNWRGTLTAGNWEGAWR